MLCKFKQSKKDQKRYIFSLCFVAVVFICFSATSYANGKNREEKPIQIHAEQALGYGLSVGYYLFPNFYLGVESYSLSDNGDILDIELEYHFKTNQIIGRYFPWDQYGFCFQIGFISRDWKVKGSNETYVGNDAVKKDTDVIIKWSESAVSYGIGWFIISESGLSGGFGVGYIAGGSPKVTIEAVGASANDIDLEEKETAKTLKDYTLFPYTHLSIGWNF